MFRPSKSDLFLQTVQVSATETITANLDLLGYDYVEIDVISTTANTTSNRPSVLKLSESDDATNFTDIVAFTGGTATSSSVGFTIPSWFTATANTKTLRFNMDTRHRKRYLKLSITPRTTQSFTALARLGHGELSPVSADEVNVLAVVAG